MDKKIQEIIKYASLFRDTLELCKAKLSISLRDFPFGACGSTSHLLGTFLKEKGLGDFFYICSGRISDGHSHAWLENNGLIVDITADQFENQESKVIVSYSSKWHFENFVKIEESHLADFRSYYFFAPELIEDYELLLEYIRLN